MENDFTHEPFDWEIDADLAMEWTNRSKRHRLLVRTWLPETGFVILKSLRPVMMLWLYFDPSCTMAYLDWVITRPRQSFMRITKPAMAYAHEVPIRKAMIDHHADILVIRGHRALVPHIPPDWYVNKEPLVSMSCFYV